MYRAEIARVQGPLLHLLRQGVHQVGGVHQYSGATAAAELVDLTGVDKAVIGAHIEHISWSNVVGNRDYIVFPGQSDFDRLTGMNGAVRRDFNSIKTSVIFWWTFPWFSFYQRTNYTSESF